MQAHENAEEDACLLVLRTFIRIVTICGLPATQTQVAAQINTKRLAMPSFIQQVSPYVHCTFSSWPIVILLVVLMIEISMTVHPNATTPIARYVFGLLFDSLI
jgi:hypothetical protein